jgi:hypothetical protein
VSEYQRQWREANRGKLVERQRQREDQLRAIIFRRYGTSCSCCGTSNDLTIDHIDGSGTEHRRSLGIKGGLAS